MFELDERALQAISNSYLHVAVSVKPGLRTDDMDHFREWCCWTCRFGLFAIPQRVFFRFQVSTQVTRNAKAAAAQRHVPSKGREMIPSR